MVDRFSGKKIMIWGYGREGKSTESFLKEYCQPQEVVIFEGKPEELEEEGFDYIFKSPGIIYPQENEKIIAQTDVFLESYREQVIGITGTKGKSTTSAMLAKVLGECSGKRSILLGNIGLPCLDYFGEMDEDTLVVFEMSCHQLAHAKISPHVAVFLNLYEEHLDYYKTMEAYFTAKSHVISYQEEGDVCYVGENVPEIATKAKRRLVQTAIPGDLPMSIYGDHNRLNAAFVKAIATECFGCKEDEVLESISSFSGLPHRLQRVGENHGITWYDDSISTIPEAAIQAVESLPEIKTILIGGMDRGIHYGILEDFMKDRTDVSFICMYATGKRIVEEAGLTGASHIYLVEDLAQAVAKAREITPSGCGCVLSPAAPSYGYFRNFEERGDVFAGLVMER